MNGEALTDEFVAFDKIPRLSLAGQQRRGGDMAICAGCDDVFAVATHQHKFCSPECRTKVWVNSNRQTLNESVRKYRARRYARDGRWRETGPKAIALRDWMVELKSQPCSDCGSRFETCCMDFDHRDGTQKLFNVGSMFAHHYSRELIETEIAKCDLVCSNCHRVRTRDRMTGQPKGKVQS